MKTGKIYMGVNVLSEDNLHANIPSEVIQLITTSRHFIVENIKNARRYLRRLDRNFSIDDSQFIEMGKHADLSKEFKSIKNTIETGENVIVLSDAGCSGIADPGAKVAAWAHEQNFYISPMVGPSSILLALMASGFNGQSFIFHGYCPKDRKERQRFLKNLEKQVNTLGQTQIFMDTPFRNLNVLEDIFEILNPDTKICIAANITADSEYIKTVAVRDLETLSPRVEKMPAMFLIGL